MESYVPIAVSGSAVAATSRYIQYRADLASGDTEVTPAVLDVAGKGRLLVTSIDLTTGLEDNVVARVVYRARQASLARVVALKVIRAGVASPGMLRRFEHEAQVLARLLPRLLDHPPLGARRPSDAAGPRRLADVSTRWYAGKQR